MKKIFILLTLIPLASFGSIYGEDNSVDATNDANISSILAENQSVGAIISKKNVTEITSSSEESIYQLKDHSRSSQRFCSNLRYARRNTPVSCSSVLIAPNKVLTASFCARKCDEIVIVFGFNSKTEDNFFRKESVFKCKKSTVIKVKDKDLRLVELDRDTNLTPMVFASRFIEPTDMLAKYGYSFGGPLELATNASVRSISHKSIISNLDFFSGDAGGPLLNQETGEAVGINISGDIDTYVNPVRYCKELLYFEENKGKGSNSIPVLKEEIDYILSL